MTATYKCNGGSAMPIPGGIFKKPVEFQIDVASALITDTGSYEITITVSDDFPMNIEKTFTLIVTNVAPKVVNAPLDVSLVHGTS
jgi:hypothetical protein